MREPMLQDSLINAALLRKPAAFIKWQMEVFARPVIA
jgi:hypothetical protein